MRSGSFLRFARPYPAEVDSVRVSTAHCSTGACRAAAVPHARQRLEPTLEDAMESLVYGASRQKERIEVADPPITDRREATAT